MPSKSSVCVHGFDMQDNVRLNASQNIIEVAAASLCALPGLVDLQEPLSSRELCAVRWEKFAIPNPNTRCTAVCVMSGSIAGWL